jgi:hypothetical protein
MTSFTITVHSTLSGGSTKATSAACSTSFANSLTESMKWDS